TVLRNMSGGESVKAALYVIGGDNSSRFSKHLVVCFDVAWVVKIVDHQACSFAHAFRRGVTEPVQTLKSRAIAEVKARDRINRFSARRFRTNERTNELERREVEDDRAECGGRVRVAVPIFDLQPIKRGRIKVFQTGSLGIGRNPLEPRPETGRRR